MQWHSEVSSDESNTERVVNSVRKQQEDISPIVEKPTLQFRDAINNSVYQFNPVIEPPPIEQEEQSSFQQLRLVLDSTEPEPPTEITINCANIEDYSTRRSRCPTLRKIPVDKGECKH